MGDGVLILDNSTLKHLRTEKNREIFTANLRVAGWQAWPTAVNLFEALQDKNVKRRATHLETLRWLAGNRGLLPWPHEVLKRVGEAVQVGEHLFRMGWSGVEGLLLQSDVTEANSQAAADFLKSQQEEFEVLHQSARNRIQAGLKTNNVDPNVFDVPRFLDEIWLVPSFYDSYLSDLWTHFGFDSPAPLDDLRTTTSWRLFIEAYGAVAYSQAFAKEQGKKVQLADVLQLVYLSAGPKRAIATEDAPFRSLAQGILHPRHLRSEAVSIMDFLQT